MCWEGWNPDWDSNEWFKRVIDSRNRGCPYTQYEVYQLNRKDEERRRQERNLVVNPAVV